MKVIRAGPLPFAIVDNRFIQKKKMSTSCMKLELISFQRKSWFIPVLARDLNDCMDDEQAFLKEIMEKMRELHTRCTHLFLLD